ncbi:chondroitin sulfate proteoglycan 5b isoform X2 [Corythoichthys intestinalis]|uniref:chondroitin sulfate proteoglycan 5b isoform X2 n=1 Tax=Corythoichthys intestinalis TaxID=161448 RepID=UPI0025A5DA16|nr:chondroitin sulfate proteoglycan 5b isoform X2 [Corythoichthys intestinalis]XP_061808414.1 chondroitin sulfate proteoglycan 5-like [Nerophis lumbriciformis]
MACGRFWTWQVLLTISVLLIPAAAHGRHSMTRRHHHRNQSSISRETSNTGMGLSEDSAERDHLIEAGRPIFSKHHRSHKHIHPDPDPVGEELTAGGAGPDQNPLSDDIIAVEFHSPAPEILPADDLPKPQKQKGGDPTAWTLSDFYDYLSPDDDLSASAPTQEPEPSPSPPADMEDENPLLASAPVRPVNAQPPGENKPVSPSLDNDENLSLGGAMGSDGCRLGFVRSGPGICVSQCDVEPNFCFNEGVCTVVAGVGAFCRCNVQDYIWNKGTRCDWAVTEFQVMSALVGVASVSLLLIFMIVVFFAKRLHRLKKENKRLRKRSKYRPQSTEPQTDGLSVSTTADGSQPNVRKLCDSPPPVPQAHTHNLAYYDNIICQDDPQKQEDPAKSPAGKEEGAMNILNSHSPKHENNRPNSVVRDSADDNTEDGVTIGLEVLLPKDAKLRPEKSPPVQYDVFLYKVTNNGEPPASNSHQHASKSPKNTKSPKRNKDHRHRHSSPFLHPSPGGYPTPSRHSAPGGCSAPVRHPSAHPCPRSRPSSSFYSGSERDESRIRPSPSSPHLTQSSPSRSKCSPVSTRSLPPLS